MENGTWDYVSSSSDNKEAPSTHWLSHHRTSTSTRRNERTFWLCHRPQTSSLLLFILFSCCISFTTATTFIDEEMVEVQAREVTAALLGSTFARLARSGTILVDRSLPPIAAGVVLHQRDELFDSQDSVSTLSASSTKLSSTSSTATVGTAATTTSSGLASATDTSSVTLPTPFDLGFSNNITSSCESFMTSMLSNATFQTCLPFSLLLQVSTFLPRVYSHYSKLKLINCLQ